ncbi:MAG: lipoprotein-releasing ABC transporter permease subunit [Porticoccaceae bacterium]
MSNNISLFIGLRYAFSKRKNGYLSFISGFSFVAMALGVMALIVVLSVMNGFDREIKGRLLQVLPHITVTRAEGYSPQQIDEFKQLLAPFDSEVSGVLPLVQTFAMVASDSSQQGLMVRGIDPSWDIAMDPGNQLFGSHLLRLQAGEFGIVLGSQVARKLNVFIGDSLELILPKISITPLGAFPRLKKMRVVGVFEVGAQVDASMAFIHQQDARMLLQLGDRFQGVQIQLQDAFIADSLIEQFSTLASEGSRWQPWTQVMGSLFQAMRMEKTVVGLLLSVIIGVAAFNIIASLVLMVSDKRKEIAVLRTLGASSGQIIQLFVVQGTAIGFFGIVLGALSGCLIALFIGDIIALFEGLTGNYLFDPSIYMISALPSYILPMDVALVVVAASLISFLATLYPAWRAGQVLPVEALRYDQ